MATTKKTAAAADEPFNEGGIVSDGAPVVLGTAEEVAPVGSLLELASDIPAPSAAADEPLPGGTYINTGAVDLVLLQPPKVLKPGHVIELEFGVRHRELRPATADEIAAAREAEAAEHAATAAPQPTTTGQE